MYNFNLPKLAKEIKEERKSLSAKNGGVYNGGVYKWWCSREKVEELLGKIGLNNKLNEVIYFMENYTIENQLLYCFYVGMTTCNKGLSGRIKGKHLSKEGNKSTLRKSLKALDYDSKGSLDFLNECYISWCEFDCTTTNYKEVVASTEKFAINENLTIFNIDDLDFSNKTEDFKELRQSIVKKIRERR